MFHNSMFGDILKMVSRTEVKTLVMKHQGDRYRKSFKTWDHLVAMLIGQLSGASRECSTNCVTGYTLICSLSLPSKYTSSWEMVKAQFCKGVVHFCPIFWQAQ